MKTGPTTRLKKDPQASSWPKGINYEEYLGLFGPDEIIVTSTWSRSGSDTALSLSGSSICDAFTLPSGHVVPASKATQVLMAGGTVGVEYLVTNHITTSSGVQDDRSFTIVVGQR